VFKLALLAPWAALPLVSSRTTSMPRERALNSAASRIFTTEQAAARDERQAIHLPWQFCAAKFSDPSFGTGFNVAALV
jgi:hypothetical protein